MKIKIMELLKENYKILSQEQIEELADQMYKLLPNKTVKLSEVEAGEKFTYAGYEFTKLADEKETDSCYCLLNETVFESKFGETNDWAVSPIRRRLNEFDKDSNSTSVKGIKKCDLVEVSLNYYAFKIPNGRAGDRITLLSWEEAYTYDFEPIAKTMWLRSGYVGNTWSAYGLAPAGGLAYNNVDGWLSVRPALHFRKDLEVGV